MESQLDEVDVPRISFGADVRRHAGYELVPRCSAHMLLAPKGLPSEQAGHEYYGFRARACTPELHFSHFILSSHLGGRAVAIACRAGGGAQQHLETKMKTKVQVSAVRSIH